jgi:FtsP/CotA-like multicopper oxidase with cupredoxin domain
MKIEVKLIVGNFLRLGREAALPNLSCLTLRQRKTNMHANRFFLILSVIVSSFVLTLILVACSAPDAPLRGHEHATIIPTSVPGCETQPIAIDQYGWEDFQNPEVISSVDGTLRTTLVVAYANNQIAGCQVHLRSYNGKLVGPTLRAKPGDTLYITLDNQLPANPTSDHEAHPNVTHGFNTTNLHTHGLHVSPEGNSDNVLLEIQPGQTFAYEIKIPPSHPSGTFWYHAHVHGATAVQVSSGMAGALIIEGGRDDVPKTAVADEKIFVFQQISYDQQGQIESLEDFGPGTWATLEREHTINGQLLPTITMQPGELQRWRMIHAGIRETIMVKLVGPSDQIPDLKRTDELPIYALNEVAVDGISLGKLVTWPAVELQPGYRSDLLVTAPTASGTYYVIDAATPVTVSLHGVAESANVLARVVVAGEPNVMPLPAPAAGPLPDILEQDITGTQVVGFCVCQDPQDPNAIKFTVNDREFSLDHKRTLKLGSVEEWLVYTDMRSLAPSHPFHIHVNPFQVQRTLPNNETEWVWRDTLLVRQGEPQRLLTHYKDYIGQYVLHCHILDHEDQGMMELVEVVLDVP